MMLTNDDLRQVGLSEDVSLFDFQLEGVDQLREQRNVLVGDEMGTGKTFFAIARDLLLREEDDVPAPRTLVVAPLSVLSSWEQHFDMLAPKLKVRVIDRKARHKFLEDLHADVYILHWDVLRLMPELRNVKWHHIIADECHKAKNRKAKQTKALKKLVANNRTAMSGTPMVNRPDELWSVLNWLKPGTFTSYWKFYEQYVRYELIYPQGFKKVIGARNVDDLKAKMQSFYIRRTKKDVLPDLPEKYYTTVWVELDERQRRAYNAMKKEMLAWIGEHDDEPLVAPVVIAKLIRLQQLALSFGEMVIDDDGSSTYYPSKPSTKLQALMDILDGTDEQIVVYSQFSKMIDLVEQELESAGISCVKLTGDVDQTTRTKNIEDFQAGRVQVFLATIKAGGVGITLHAASTVVFLDRSWSPAENLQSEDRLHRHGQENAVQVIDLMARDTVDLGRRQTLELKWSWIKEILE